MDEDERPGPPPLGEDVVQERPPTDFAAPERTDTEGLTLDRSSYTAPSPTVRKAPPLPSPAPREVPETVASEMGRLLGSGVALVVALVVCLLPAFWRERIERRLGNLPFRLATFVTGIAEVATMLVFGLDAMYAFMQARLAETGPVMMDFALKHDLPPRTMHEMHQVQGAALWVAFMISPVGLSLAFFALEGSYRVVAATWGGEALGTVPLWLVDQVRWLARLREQRRPAVLPIDTIVKDQRGILVSIQSARAYAWDHTTTLRFEERLYEVEEQRSSEERERPYLFCVREASPGHLIRKVTEYTPAP